MCPLSFAGTREAAYVLAVTSAGVSHSVTRACSTGLHDSCGCDRTIYDMKYRNKKHRWSGCSDNIHFGDAFARRFIDSYERRTMRRNPGLAMMKLHNNAAGRLVRTPFRFSANLLLATCSCAQIEADMFLHKGQN